MLYPKSGQHPSLLSPKSGISSQHPSVANEVPSSTHPFLWFKSIRLVWWGGGEMGTR